ncbi:unnamed protein product [Penicillium pancosmium]
MPIRGVVKQKYLQSQDEADSGVDLSWADTKNLLLQLADQGTTTICIDAIDECDTTRRTDFLNLIKTLLHGAKGRVKILLSSRPSSDISARLKSLKCLSIDTGQNQQDIKRYAQLKAAECIEGMKMREIPVSENLTDKLAKELVKGAQGMFLWIKLQVTLLTDPNQTLFESDILQRCRTLPEGLSQLYETIYGNIEQAGDTARKIAFTLFRWLLCAIAPISKHDLMGAVSYYVTGKRDSLTESMIQDSCSNLVIFDEDLNTFRFIHTSVKDFFEGKPGFNLQKRHATAAEVCLKIISDGIPVLEGLSLERSSLQCYVILYWAYHIEGSAQQQSTEKIKDALNGLFIRDGNFKPWFRQWLPQVEPVSQILDWSDPFKDKIIQALSSPDTPLFTACTFGFSEVVQRHSKAKPELVRKKNAMGATGLHLASQYGHLMVVKELLEHEPDLNAKDQFGETPLIRASTAGHADIVCLLFEKGASVKIQGRRFETALQGAALHGHVEIIESLLQFGANVESDGGQFGTALQAAALRGHVRAVEYLISAGADVNAPGGDYETVYKAAPDEDYAESVRKAVEYAIKVQRERDSSRNFYSDPMKMEDTAQLLLDPNLDMNFKENGFGAAIQAASRAGHDDVVAVLLKVDGINVNIEGGRYGSALQAAAVCGTERIILRLLEAKADINAQNGTYGTALIAASRRSHYQIVKLLIREGAEVNVQAGVYGTALQAAARSGDSRLVLLLLNHGARVNLKAGEYCTALQAAARNGFENIAKTLIDHGADVNIKGGRFNTALQAAATGGHIKLARLLVTNGAKYGDSLMIACLGGYLDVVQYLLECGADLNAESTGFGTALEAATAGRHLPLVRYLLTKGADPNSSGWDFGTPLQLGAINGDADLVQALLDKGADPTKSGSNHGVAVSLRLFDKSKVGDAPVEDFSRSAPLVCAVNGGSKNIVNILLKAMRRSKDSLSPRNRDVALRAASKLGYLEIIQLILDDGFETSDMTKALSAAIGAGQEKVVQ